MLNAKFRALVFAAMCASVVQVQAHEFWIEPEQFTAKPGDQIAINLKIGELFKGRSYPYIQRQSNRFEWIYDQSGIAVDATTGDKPATRWADFDEPFRYLVYASTEFDARFNDADKFLKYLDDEGLNWVIDWYAESGADPKEATETYYRHAKTLIAREGASDPGAWIYEPTGLLMDIVPEPGFLACEDTSEFQVVFDGEPEPNLLVKRFQKESNQVAARRTDEQGRVSFPGGEGPYLLNVVKIAEGEGDPRAEGLDWVSDWASFSYTCLKSTQQ